MLGDGSNSKESTMPSKCTTMRSIYMNVGVVIMEDRYAGMIPMKVTGKTKVYFVPPAPMTQEEDQRLEVKQHRIWWKIWDSLPTEEKIRLNELYGPKVISP